MAQPPSPHPPPLPAGTQVGPWRLETWHAQGAYGALYRAVRVDQEHAGPVALKLSLNPWDQRFVREAQLLARLSHPCIPQLLDQGVLRSPSGAEHPWFAMQWVDGAPLYAWAQHHRPSHLQRCLLLSRLARALEALHASGAVHRDVKGDNVLVRAFDALPFLIDFGSGHFPGAPRLTWQSLPPHTPAYLSPQAALFDIRLARQRNAYYAPSPADDLYALGVTAFRLVMGRYPPELDVHEEGQGGWRVASPDVRPLLDSNPQVQPPLRDWLIRLMSQEPEQRGSAAELAQALEAEVARHSQAPRPAPAPASEPPLSVTPAPTRQEEVPRRAPARRQPRAFGPWLALVAAAAVALMLWSQPRSLSPEHVSANPPGPAQAHAPDAGTTGVSEGEPSAPRPAPPPSREQSVSQDTPVIPRAEQARPDAKGRCPMPKHVLFNGFCWVDLAGLTAEECAGSGYVFRKGKCYGPALELPQKPAPTSAPGEAR